MGLLSSFLRPQTAGQARAFEREVDDLIGCLRRLYGDETFALRLKHLRAAELIQSPRLEDRVLAVQRLVHGDSSLETAPSWWELPQVLPRLRQQVEEQSRRHTLADDQAERERYVSPLWHQEQQLRDRYQVRLSPRATEMVEPKCLDEVIGQTSAKRALLAKLASPFPQHVLLYGPPGVGKTTVARLVFEQAKRLPGSPFRPDAPFVEVDGSSLRWDYRDLADPLLGSVHDPIYQGIRPDLGAAGLPDPHLGLVTQAHGGVLFIDEIGDLPPELVARLLKVLEEKRVHFHSAYYDADNPAYPPSVRRLFEEGAPADFVLIGATSRAPAELPPALRSRCAEVFFQALLPEQIQAIVRQCTTKLQVAYDPAVPELISRRTADGRKATQMILDAYSLAYLDSAQSPSDAQHLADGKPLPRAVAPERRPRGPLCLTPEVVTEAIQLGRLSVPSGGEVLAEQQAGRILGLAVSGWTGTVVEIEAAALPARSAGQGQMRFNEAAGQMARDAVFTSLTLIRRLTGIHADDWDIHVNILGGGRVDGPSIGAPLFLVLVSALWNLPLRQDMAVTGEISLLGRIRPVGSLVPKLLGAKRAGIRQVIVPAAQREDVPAELWDSSWTLSFVENVADLWQLCFPAIPVPAGAFNR
ncbi:MAG: AAA family ATPase [Limnochordaceae bacterium]|nr:AAA family ATPase [Limnochordaceae bacterium]